MTDDGARWNAMHPASKANLLRVVDEEAQLMFAMAEDPGRWKAPTAAEKWQVRDMIGHMIDVTEGYFRGFDIARGKSEAPAALGTRVMAEGLNEAAQSFRKLSQAEAMERVKSDYQKMMEIFEGLSDEDWTDLIVPHKYMGSLPAFFYPTFHLMDYGVHSWDIREGVRAEHGLTADVADLLVPFMFILWQATLDTSKCTEPLEVGIRVTGRNAGTYRVRVAPDGLTYQQGEVGDLPVVFDFDPAGLVLTAFGRIRGGTATGNRDLADRYRSVFFRI